jgi:hypothetical protein
VCVCVCVLVCVCVCACVVWYNDVSELLVLVHHKSAGRRKIKGTVIEATMDRIFKLSVGLFQSLSTITCQVLYEAAVELVSEVLRHVGPKHSKGPKRIENKDDAVSQLKINQDRKEEIEEQEWREQE